MLVLATAAALLLLVGLGPWLTQQGYFNITVTQRDQSAPKTQARMAWAKK